MKPIARTMLGPRVYRVMHRMFRCDRCNALPGDRCFGARGPIEACHLERKKALEHYRRESPLAYMALRTYVEDFVLRELGQPRKIPTPRN